MTISEWLKPGLIGTLLGAGALAVIGFGWGGWQTAAGAQALAATQATSRVNAALVPMCLDRSRSDPASFAKLEALRAAPLVKRHDLMMQSGWAIPPGGEAADTGLALACLDALAVAAP